MALQLTTNEQTVIDDVVRKRGGTPMDALHAVHQARGLKATDFNHKTTIRGYINGETRRRSRKEKRGALDQEGSPHAHANEDIARPRGNTCVGHVPGQSARAHMRPASQPASTPAMSTRQPASPPSLPESGVTWPKPGSAPEPDRHRARASRCLRQWSGWGDQPKCTISKRLACANVRINLTQTNGLVN